MHHIYREASYVVDGLVAIGLKLRCDNFEFPNPLGEILHLLEDDKLGSSHLRVVSM